MDVSANRAAFDDTLRELTEAQCVRLRPLLNGKPSPAYVTAAGLRRTARRNLVNLIRIGGRRAPSSSSQLRPSSRPAARIGELIRHDVEFRRTAISLRSAEISASRFASSTSMALDRVSTKSQRRSTTSQTC
jgi:hypothetical protein